MPPSDPLNHRIASLDCLRGLAAISVVVFHFTMWFHSNYGHDFESWAWLYYLPYGVHLFFMLSGFVIVKSLDHGQGIGSFAIARAFRLLPALWVAIPLTMISVHFLGPQDRAAGTIDAAANTLLIHEYFFLEHVDGAYWTLVLLVIVLAYLISRYIEQPALTYYKRRRAQRRAGVLKQSSCSELRQSSCGVDRSSA